MVIRNSILLATFLSLSIHLDMFGQGRGFLSDWHNITAHNWIRQMSVDGDALWLATNGGLLRYDKAAGEAALFTRSNSGLSDNDILSVGCNDGIVFAGSRFGGVNRYDGMSFNCYDTSNSPLLFGNDYTGFAFGADGSLWIGGLMHVYEFSDGSWQTFSFPGADYCAFLAFTAMAFDSKGTLWLGIEGPYKSHLARILKDGTVEVIPMAFGSVNALAVDVNDGVWLSSCNYGIAHYDGSEFEYFNSVNSPFPNNDANGICIDEANNVWFGTGRYLCKYDGKEFSSYELPDDVRVSCLLADSGNIWIGTFLDGLYQFSGGAFRHVYTAKCPMVTGEMGFHSTVCNDGNVYIAAKESLLRYDTADQWSRLFYKPGTLNNRASAVATADDGTLWVALYDTDTCLVRVAGRDTTCFTTENSPLPRNGVHTLATDRGGRLWAGTSSGLHLFDGSVWTCFDHTNTPLKSDDVYELCIGQDGKVWAGAYVSGLYVFDGKTWREYNSSNSPMTTNLVRGLTVDSKNRTWFCCSDDSELRLVGPESGDGLFCIDGSGWHHWNMQNSPLPSNTIMDIAVDRDDRLWLATFGSVGLTSFDGNDGWHVYGTGNSGIANNDVISLAVDNHRDILWISQYWGAGLTMARLNTDASGLEPPVFRQVSHDGVYDLNGRRRTSLSERGRLQSTHPSRGVYIENGRKRIAEH